LEPPRREFRGVSAQSWAGRRFYQIRAVQIQAVPSCCTQRLTQARHFNCRRPAASRHANVWFEAFLDSCIAANSMQSGGKCLLWTQQLLRTPPIVSAKRRSVRKFSLPHLLTATPA
jgi:hypothetical protein